MISFLRRHQKSLFVGVIVIFLLGIFVGLGGYLFTSNDMSGTVASVGKTKIPYAQFITRVNQYSDALRSRGADIPDELMREVKQGMLRDMIIDELLLERAAEMGLTIADGELARDIQNTPAFQRNGAFSQDAYFQAVRAVYRDTPEAYEKSRRKQLSSLKVKQLLYHCAKMTPQELRDAYAKENKGSLKNFEKDKDAFAQKAQQQRALEVINYYLRQISTQVEIRSYLDQRESGA